LRNLNTYGTHVRRAHAGSAALLAATLLIVAAALPPASYAQAEQKGELTLSEFRNLARKPAAPDKAVGKSKSAPRVEPRPDHAAADRAFFALLTLQGRQAAARQSLDRLSGWYKAAQQRLQAQNAPALDVDTLRYAELRAAAAVDGLEDERLQAVGEANALLGRPASSTLTVLLEQQPSSAADGKTAPSAGQSTATVAGQPDQSSRRQLYEQKLLPLGAELLSKAYQSYLYGGLPVVELLWQEQQVHRSELEYRLLLVEAERTYAVETAGP
jgi:hypothetical protein